jgi:co-chaperonin GroES (HSP10)
MEDSQKLSFNFRMRFGLILLFCGLFFRAYAQDKQPVVNYKNPVEGIIYDKDTQERIARTNILNVTSGESYYNNLKGEFKIDAKAGDKLVFLKLNYFADTITIKDNTNLVISLKRMAIPLREVTIRDTLVTPLQRLQATKRNFSKAYGSNSYDGVLTGAGLSIDAIWNSLSRSGRNAKHLQGLIEEDYQQNVIDYRFNRSYVSNITKLKDQELTDFMARYRPGYFIVTTATDYEFITYIRNSLKRYLRNKRLYSQPSLNVNKGQKPD